MVQGFLPSGTLFALLKLRVFELIAESEKTATELASQLDAQPEHLARLLNAGVMLGILERVDGSFYRIPQEYRPMLVASGQKGYLGHWLQFMASWWEWFGALDQAILTGGKSNMYAPTSEFIRRDTLAMHDFALLRGAELSEFLDTTEYRTMLDVGCGPGTYSFELGLRNAALELHLLDLPFVLTVTREVQKQYQLSNVVRYLPRELLCDPIPGSYDLVLISNVLQAFDEEKIRSLLTELYQAVNPGGSIVVQAQFLWDDRVSPRWPVFVDLACLCLTDGGRNHSMAETQTWLEEAGFVDVGCESMSVLNANGFVRGYRR